MVWCMSRGRVGSVPEAAELLFEFPELGCQPVFIDGELPLENLTADALDLVLIEGIVHGRRAQDCRQFARYVRHPHGVECRRRFGAAERIWIMDRGIPTEEILPLLRAADSGVRGIVKTRFEKDI